MNGYVSDDSPINEISWSVSGDNELTVEIIGKLATIGYNAGWTGSETVIFIATDGNGATGESNGVVFTVNEVIIPNEAPVVSDIPDQAINEGEDFTTIELDNYVSDDTTPINELSWSVSGGSQVSVSIDENRIATVSSDWVGNETLTFTATDNEGEVSNGDEATFIVNAAPEPEPEPENEVPIMILKSNGNILVDGSEIVLEAEEGITFDLSESTDADGDALVYGWGYALEGQDIGDYEIVAPISMSYNFNPNVKEDVSYELEFTLRDGDNGEDVKSVIVRYNAAPEPEPENTDPVVGNIPDRMVTTGEEFSVINLNSYVSDDSPISEISWDVTGDNELTVDIVDGMATVTYTEGFVGSEVLTFIATDEDGGSDSDKARFTINDVPAVIEPKKRVNKLGMSSIMVNNGQTAKAGEDFSIDIVAENNGNVKQKNVRIVVQIPQLEYYGFSEKFSIKKGQSEVKSFSVDVPSGFREDELYAIVTMGNSKDKNTRVIGFLVE